MIAMKSTDVENVQVGTVRYKGETATPNRWAFGGFLKLGRMPKVLQRMA